MSSSGIPRAGMVYNLTCTVSKTVDGLINSPTSTWTAGGVTISSGNGITVSDVSIGTATLSTLTFDPLKTSHHGNYWCNGTLISPALNFPLIQSTMEAVSVQSMSE